MSLLTAYVHGALETQDPVDLVCLLYGKAIEKLKAAREHLERGEIAERARAIGHASQVVLELQGSLDGERGGPLAVELARLYDYIQERLVEANARQQREPIDECLRLLETVYLGWLECRAAGADRTTPDAATMAALPPTPERQAERSPFFHVDVDDEAELVGAAAPRAWTL